MRTVIPFAVLALVATGWPQCMEAAPLLSGLESTNSDQILESVLKLPNAEDYSSNSLRELKAGIERFRAKDLNGCRERFEAAVKAYPQLPPARLMLARLLLAAGRVADGRRELELAATDKPQHPEVYLVFGELALAERRVTDAELHFDKARRLIDGATEAAKESQTVRWNTSIARGRAAVAERRSNWDMAEAALVDWLKLDPDNSTARQRLGRALFQLKRSKEAYDVLLAASKADESLEPAAVTMARFYQQSDNSAKADEWIEYATKTQPSDPRVPRAAVMRLLELGRASEAKPHIERLMELDPNTGDIPRIQGLVARQLGDHSTAEQIFEELYRKTPADFAAVNQLALVLIEQKDESKQRRAIQLAEINARQFPRSVEALATLGWVYYHADRLVEAERLLRAAVSGGRASSDIAYYLARVLDDRGQSDEARRLMEGAVAASGPFLHRADASSWLKKLSLPNPDAESQQPATQPSQ